MNNTSTDRVALAIEERLSPISELLKANKLEINDINIILIIYKESNKLDLYIKATEQKQYKRLTSYAISARSGTLGPKKMEGDKQTPEGFYYINRFNPNSKYYLSLGINYPNELDDLLGHTGSDIFIHGGIESQGCLAMTDELIKEIYLYAYFATKAGQANIPVYIFPFEMTNENIEQIHEQIDATTLSFWKNLQEGYLHFLSTRQELKFSIKNYNYTFHP